LFNLSYIGLFEIPLPEMSSDRIESLQAQGFNVLMSVFAGLVIYAIFFQKPWGRQLSIIFLIIFLFFGFPNSVAPRPEWLKIKGHDQRMGAGAVDFFGFILRLLFFIIFIKSKKVALYFAPALDKKSISAEDRVNS
jgi:hypothetical protein